MFNGGGVNPEQFHQFIASTTRTTLPLSLPLTLPLNHHHHPNFISSFDPQQLSSHHHHQLFQSQLLHHHHHQLHQNTSTHEEEEEKEEDRVVDCGSLEQLEGRGGGGGGGVRSVSETMDPWDKEEVVALLSIRSNMGTNGFSDFIWEHVSRKLAELGFKRSAEKCKEKFEEMDQYNNTTSTTTTTTTTYGKNSYNRSFSELEALFEDQNPKSTSTTTTTTTFTHDQNMVISEGGGGGGEEGKVEENSGNETLENPYVENQQTMVKKQHRKKRKRQHKLELLKGLCEEIVNKIMVQQEELHRKLLEDMERKEEQRVAREEAWKRNEMDRVNKEVEIRSQEQAIACDRESTIIEFLKKLTSTQSQNQELLLKFDQDTTNNTSSQNPPNPKLLAPSPSISPSQNPNPISKVARTPKVPIPSTTAITTRNPNSSTTQHNPKVLLPNSSTLDSSAQNPSSSSTTTTTTTTTPFAAASQDPSSTTSINDRATDDIGKRWPRDEVYSLINLRCNIYNNNNGTDQDKETTKIPLWERISQGMLELGYKRSAKKCKEKWENINKYFRKTKDANKKRSIDSKTCPYFHQLNSLYNQGTLTLPSADHQAAAAAAVLVLPDNHLMSSPENQSASPKTRCTGGSSEGGAVELNADHHHHHHDQGEKNINISQVSPLEFEY